VRDLLSVFEFTMLTWTVIVLNKQSWTDGSLQAIIDAQPGVNIRCPGINVDFMALLLSAIQRAPVYSILPALLSGLG